MRKIVVSLIVWVRRLGLLSGQPMCGSRALESLEEQIALDRWSDDGAPSPPEL
jgi:hypothetical protein